MDASDGDGQREAAASLQRQRAPYAGLPATGSLVGAEGSARAEAGEAAHTTRAIILYVRTAYWLIFATMAALSAVDFVTDNPFLWFNLVTRLFTLCVGGCVLVLGLRKSSPRATPVATLIFCAAVMASTVWQVSFTGDLFAAPLAAVGLALVAAWSLPWSIGYQTVLAALGAAAIIANAAVMERIHGGDILVPLLLTTGSVPMALLGSRRRSALAAARSEARQAGEQLHRIAENADEVLWVFDLPSATFAYISPGVEALCGVPAEQICKKLSVFLNLVHPDDRDRVSREIAGAGQGYETACVDHRIRRPDGTLRWAQLRLAPIRNEAGKVVRMGGVIRDITAEWELTEAQRRAREQAETATRLKDQFLASMSHEIRTPLNGVIGMVDLLRDSSLLPAQRAQVETIHACGKQLLSLVNDLLDFSKIEAGKVEVVNTELEVGEVVAYAVQLFAPWAAEKSLELSYHIDIPPFAALRGDPEILREILTNLVANAVKFTEAGRVAVRVSMSEDRSGAAVLRFEIEDTGVGVALGVHEDIFEPFVQADTSVARRFGGTGLGLAIAQRLVRLVGGEIQFDSTPGRGSTFWFTARVEQGGVDAADDRTLPRKRVLVATASTESRACLSAELIGWGVTVHQVASLDDAHVAVAASERRGEPYDLLVADVGTSATTPLAFIRAIGRASARPAPPIGFIASSGRPGDGPAACDAGAAFYLHVPARPTRLFEQLQSRWAASVDEAAAPTLPQRARRILVVEDNLLNQRVAVAMVERVGYHAEVVATGVEALEALETGGFDAVLMDCQLPDMDGFETTMRIREREHGTPRRVPVIALTASATQAARERCLAAGMDDYLTKPIQRPLLGATLARWTAAGKTVAVPADPVDRGRLRELTNGDAAELERYTRMFRDEVAQGVREIHSGASASDREWVLAVLHRLKGAAASVGAVAVFDSLTRIEGDVRAEGVGPAQRGATHLEDVCRQFVEAVKTQSGAPPTSAGLR